MPHGGRCTVILKLTRYLLGVCLLVFSAQVSGEEAVYETVFTSLCISDKIIGFNYKGGEWIPSQYKEEQRWIIEKVNVNLRLPRGSRM